jgi:hypothetical protein
MKSFLTLLLLIIAISAVPALAATLDSQYIVVLGESAPSSDAILGANFAASMKGTVAVTFSSAIDTQLYREITDEELGSKTFVIINGEDREVRIIGTSNAAAAADTYFSRMGFETQLITSPSREDLLVDAPETTAGTDIDAEVETAVQPQDVVDEIIQPLEAAPTVRAEANADGINADTQDNGTSQEPQQGVFSRVISWFRGLF